MKTEKRLTMALSVLVALMMLAVPLASSSNLFVDGGQTNSNGDAPLLGADAPYVITFDFSADDSLDKAVFKGNVSIPDLNGIKFTVDADNKKIYAAVPANGTSTIGDIIIAINNVISSNGTTADKISREGYEEISSWEDGKGNVYTATSTEKLGDSVTLIPTWELKTDYFIINIETYVDGEPDKTYTKAYEATGVDEHSLTKDEIDDLKKNITVAGLVVNEYSDSIFEKLTTDGNGNNYPIYTDINSEFILSVYDVYSKSLQTSSGKDVIDETPSANVKAGTTLKLVAELDTNNFYAINIESEAFTSAKDNTVTLYAFNDSDVTFDKIFIALQFLMKDGSIALESDMDGAKLATNSKLVLDTSGVSNEKDLLLYGIAPIKNSTMYYAYDDTWKLIKFIDNDNTDNTYSLGDDKRKVSDINYVEGKHFLLDAEIVGYTAIFMVDGKYDVVVIPNATKATEVTGKTSLNTENVKSWSILKTYSSDYNGYAILEMLGTKNKETLPDLSATFEEFKKSNANQIIGDESDGVVKDSKDARDDGKTYAIVLVGNSQAYDETAYAIFDANDYAGTLGAINKSNSKYEAAMDTINEYGERLANFGHELVSKIIVSGGLESKISILPDNPVIIDDVEDKDKFKYFNWFLHVEGGYDNEFPNEGPNDNHFQLDLGYFGDNEGEVSYISADWMKSDMTITFHVDGGVNGIFHYAGEKIEDIYDLIYFQYKEKLYPVYYALNVNYEGSNSTEYKKSYDNYNKTTLEATNAFAMVIDPYKAGHYVDTWTDAPSNGKTMISEVGSEYIERESGSSTNPTDYVVNLYYYLHFDELTESADFYANFSPLSYIIAYHSNSADAPNSVLQFGFADVSMKLLGDKTFSNDKFSIIISWNDRSDNAGKTYALGADFVLTSQQLDDMGITAYAGEHKYSDMEAGQTIPGGLFPTLEGITGDLTFFGIWTFNTDSGSGSGDSSSGGDDNTNTYILIIILILIIALIAIIILMMRNKN